MRRLSFASVCIASIVALTGCGNTTTGEATRTVPPGPVSTAPAAAGVIPAGTELTIRTQERIDTDQAVSGQTYSAEIAREIVDSQGRTLIPAGSPAELFVADLQEAGITGQERLELGLRSITVGGRNYTVATPAVAEEGAGGLGANRRTAVFVGGGALLGTLVGGIAGGGSGAAIGAISGAAGGALAQILTRGSRITVPAESVLTFRLDQPIQLQGFSS